MALMEWGKGKIVTEFQAKETVRDVKFLHNEKMFAVAQKKYEHSLAPALLLAGVGLRGAAGIRIFMIQQGWSYIACAHTLM